MLPSNEDRREYPRVIVVALLLTLGAASVLPLAAQTGVGAQGDSVPWPSALAQLASGEPVIRSVRDRQGINTESLLAELEEAKLPARKGSRTPVTVAVALATARKLTTATLPADAPTDPVALRAAATVTALGDIGAAQAFLLEAERREPGNLATRISLATLLIAQGYPEEALALIGPKPPEGPAATVRGVNLRAGWFLTRGNGLLCGNKPGESIDPFKEAGKEDPFLSESARGQAKAHLMLGNRGAARQALRRASRQPQEVAWDEGGELHEIRYARLYDLSRGRHRELQEITPPEGPAGVLPFLATLKTMGEELQAAQGAATQRLTAVGDAVLQAGLREGSVPPEPGTATLGLDFQASSDAMNIMTEPLGVIHPVNPWDPTEPAAFSYRALLPQWDEEIAAIDRRDGLLGQRTRAMLRTVLVYMDEMPRQSQAFYKQVERLPTEREPYCRALISLVAADLPVANALFFERDQSLRAWFTTAWSLATAIASHADGLPHEQAVAQLEASVLQAEFFRLFDVSTLYSRYAMLEDCKGYLDGSLARERAAERREQEMLKCDPFLKGMNLKLKIPDANGSSLFDVKINCNKIQIKGKVVQLIPEVLALKLGAEWTPGSAGGEVTGLIGVSATAGPITASTDLYITVNSTGVTEGGIKGSIDGNQPLDVGENATGQLSVSGKLSGRDMVDIASGVNVDTVTDLMTGGGTQVIRDAVLYWAPGS